MVSEPEIRQYTAEELESLSQTPRRTIRYYIQLGLVDRPVGETRAAYYTWKHLEQLLRIRRLSEEGFSLERIDALLRAGAVPGEAGAAAAVAPAPGTVTVRSHVHLAPGLELVIEPERAGMAPETLRRLVRELLAAHARVIQSQGNDHD
jgi:DNA-binding transcriptional MerR regulator